MKKLGFLSLIFLACSIAWGQLPPGAYPIGGPIVLTGERPAADEALYAAGARWLGPDGYEVIERSGSVGSYTYAWAVKGGGDGSSADLSRSPYASLQRQPLAGPYTAVSFSQSLYDNAQVTPGQIMVSTPLPVGGRGVLIGLTTDDADLLSYLVAAAADDGDVDLIGTVSGSTEISGTVHTVVDLRSNRVLIRIDPASIGSISAGDVITLTIGNRTLALIRALEAQESEEGLGPPVNIASGTVAIPMASWVDFPISEAIERNREYQFILQRGSDADAIVATPSFYGSELLDLGVNAGGGFSRNTEDDQLGLAVGRIEEGGAVGMSVARSSTATTLLLRCFLNNTYQAQKLLKLPERGGSAGGGGGVVLFSQSQVSGSPNDITLTSPSGEEITSYDGLVAAFISGNLIATPSSPITVNIDGVGKRPVVDKESRPLHGNNVLPGEHLLVSYDNDITSFVVLNKDIVEESSIAKLLGIDALNTPRRVPTLPHESQPDELVVLTQDGPVSESNHDWTFDDERAVSSPGVYVVGAAIAGGIPGLAAALGSSRSAIFQASGIRAVYTSTSDRGNVWVVVSRALISDANAATPNNYHISISIPQSGAPIHLAGQAASIASTTDTRTLRFPFPNAYDSFISAWQNVTAGTYTLSLRHNSDYLHINSGTVEFGGLGTRTPKGVYQGVAGGGWERRLLAKPPRVLQAAVDSEGSNGVNPLVLPTDYATYRKVALVVWSSHMDRILEVELHTAMLAVQTDANQAISIGNRGGSNPVFVTWNRSTRAFAGPTSGNDAITFIYAELED